MSKITIMRFFHQNIRGGGGNYPSIGISKVQHIDMSNQYIEK